MQNLVIWFEDLTQTPDRAFMGSKQSQGMPEDWLEAIIGVGNIEQRRYADEGVLSGVIVSLPMPLFYDNFEKVLRGAAHKLGTNPWIRNYEEPSYRKCWDEGLGLNG